MTRDGFVYQTLNLLDLGNIASDKLRLAWTVSAYFGGERVAFLLVTRTEDNLRARADKSANATFANSFATASDDDDFVPIGHIRILHFGFAQKTKSQFLAVFTRLARRVTRPVVLRLGAKADNRIVQPVLTGFVKWALAVMLKQLVVSTLKRAD